MARKKMTDELSGDAPFSFIPMIDVVFLILIFFMLMPFKQIEEKIECFLPTDEGQMAVPKDLEKPEEVSIFIKDDHKMRKSGNFRHRSERRATFYLGSRDGDAVRDPYQLLGKLQRLATDKDQEVLIALYDESNDEADAKDQLVPFFNVVNVLDVCKKAGIVNVKFQAPSQMK